MEKRAIYPPFDAHLLRSVGKLSLENGCDATTTIDWLLAHDDMQQMKTAIVDVWKTSSLPLCEWAYRVDCVEAWITQCDLGLRVNVIGEKSAVVQKAPLSNAYLEMCLKSFPKPIHAILKDLALCAPGLSLDERGEVAHPRYYRNRLGYVRQWLEGLRVVPETNVCLDDFVMEVASNGLGDVYVLHANESLWFFDHEEPRLYALRISLDELMATYFDSPTRIMDPWVLGWTDNTVSVRFVNDDSSEVEPEVCLPKFGNLTLLGKLAIAIRYCHELMGMPSWDEIPQQLTRYIPDIKEALQHVSSVACGHRVEEAWFVRSRARLLEASEEWSDCPTDDTAASVPGSGIALALVELGKACVNLSAEAARKHIDNACALLWAKCPLQAQKSVNADAEYLASLELGDVNTIGQPIPRHFFERSW